MEIRHTYVNELPVLALPDRLPKIRKLFGAVHSPDTKSVYFPLFPPFQDLVLQTLSQQVPEMQLHPHTQALLNGLPNYDAIFNDVTKRDFPTKSMPHQLEGLAELLYNLRWALQWQMGTGKSKVVVDALGVLRQPALILCPFVAIKNWKKEIDKHSDGTLNVVLLDGTAKKKKRQLQENKDADVFVATYDTARLYGVPTMYDETVKIFKSANMIPNPHLRSALMNLNDREKQVELAHKLAQGTPNSVILTEAAKITQSLPTCIEHLPYKIIVADESHRIKRIQSKRTRFCLQLSAKAQRRWELTGTMSLGDPRDLYPQLQFLAPYMMPEDWTLFCRNHLVTSPHNRNIVVKYKNVDKINERVSMVSSTRTIECLNLPERFFIPIDYELSQEQIVEYNRAANDYKLWIDKTGEEADIAHSALAIAKLLQICSGFVYVPVPPDMTKMMDSQDMTSHLTTEIKRDTQRYASNPKLVALMDQLEDLINGQGSKVIIWAQYIAELDDIENALKSASFKYVRVDGTTSSKIQDRVDEFQENKSCQVYLAQVRTGIAITLTAAKYSIYYSRPWSLEDREQSSFRNYRIGQTETTIVYDLIASGTIEDQQLTALHNKQVVADLLTQRPDCLVCSFYSGCLKRGIQPWDNDCVLEKDPHRVVTKPTPIKET